MCQFSDRGLNMAPCNCSVGLPECALDRDQRTVTTICRSREAQTRVGCCSSNTEHKDSSCVNRESCLDSLRRSACMDCRAARSDSEVSNRNEVPISSVSSVTATDSRRRHRAFRSIWRKYASVSAVLVLVFIVGGVCPGCLAAPMSRQGSPRNAGPERPDSSKIPWANPCGMDFGNKSPSDGTRYSPELATKVQKAARNAMMNEEYRDLFTIEKQKFNFVEQHSRSLTDQSNLEHPWYSLPEKALGEPLKKDHYKSDDERDTLPKMYKYLELLSGAMYRMARSESQLSSPSETNLPEKLMNTFEKLKQLLCEFDELLYLKNFKKLPLTEWDEIPTRPNDETTANIQDFLVFRDTLNFLEILEGYFGYMADS